MGRCVDVAIGDHRRFGLLDRRSKATTSSPSRDEAAVGPLSPLVPPSPHRTQLGKDTPRALPGCCTLLRPCATYPLWLANSSHARASRPRQRTCLYPRPSAPAVSRDMTIPPFREKLGGTISLRAQCLGALRPNAAPRCTTQPIRRPCRCRCEASFGSKGASEGVCCLNIGCRWKEGSVPRKGHSDCKVSARPFRDGSLECRQCCPARSVDVQHKAPPLLTRVRVSPFTRFESSSDPRQFRDEPPVTARPTSHFRSQVQSGHSTKVAILPQVTHSGHDARPSAAAPPFATPSRGERVASRRYRPQAKHPISTRSLRQPIRLRRQRTCLS
jgi:hypothetical protein